MRMPERLREKLLLHALGVMAHRAPDFSPGDVGDPFLQRWWLIAPNAHFNVWLHKFLKSDLDKVPHDCSMDSCSLILSEGYFEQTREGKVWRDPGQLIFRKASEPHRVLVRKPAITLFVTGRPYRKWGFHLDDGSWMSHDEAQRNPALAAVNGIMLWKNPEAESKAKF